MPGAISPWEIRVPRDAIITRSPALADDPAVRAVTVIGLIAVGIIHSLEIPGQVSAGSAPPAGRGRAPSQRTNLGGARMTGCRHRTLPCPTWNAPGAARST